MVLGLLFSLARAAELNPRDAEIARIRNIFAESTRADVRFYAAPEEARRSMPSGYSVSLPLFKVPVDLLVEAINQSIRMGDKEEVAGALDVYCMFARENKIPRSQAYFQAVRDMLAHDDLTFPMYTNVIAEVITLYPSKDSVTLLADLAGRVPKPEQREQYLFKLADLLGVDIPISTTTQPLEKEKLLADFQSWVERNKDRFEFGKNGRVRLVGGEARGGQAGLTTADRQRIQKDPACLLRLINAMVADTESSAGTDAKALLSRCGTALLGEEGAKVALKAVELSEQGSDLSLDLQAQLASVHGNYPVMDAVLLAIAYVAAYEPDPEARRLARQTLADLGTPEIARVLKGEPRIVRKKMEELGEEVLKH